MKDELGSRIKEYEAVETSRKLDLDKPIYARIDGRCFSNYTRGLIRPYDPYFSNIMVEVTKFLVEQTNARIGYTQSDEISLAWYRNESKGNIFFDGKTQKMTSVLSSLATSKFCQLALSRYPDKPLPSFDCRVFNLPDEVELSNVFLWREFDATKNAVSMASHYHFSHKTLHKKNTKEMIDMLEADAGVKFEHYPIAFRKGTWCRRILEERRLTDEELQRIPEKNRPSKNDIFIRSKIVSFHMEDFKELSLENRIKLVTE